METTLNLGQLQLQHQLKLKLRLMELTKTFFFAIEKTLIL